MQSIPIIDVFAGPGGLNEGFNRAASASHRFKTALSIEMDPVACQTLRLRSVRRQLEGQPELAKYYDYVSGVITADEFRSYDVVLSAFKRADEEVLELELGPDSRLQSRAAIAAALGERASSDWVLIGGPPCQAYSVAGRSRRANDELFHEDKKHFLYREYLAILQDFAPAVFVMENVKGLLSSTHSDSSMFARIVDDLTNPKPGLTYQIQSLGGRQGAVPQPSDFVLRAEDYGVPQRRHRVILIGIRSDVLARGFDLPTLMHGERVSVGEAILDLPALRSRLSPTSKDSQSEWGEVRARAATRAKVKIASDAELSLGSRFINGGTRPSKVGEYAEWVAAPALKGVLQHEARAHMAADLERYFHISESARKYGVSPKLRDLPADLLPLHKNAASDRHPFEDRFRVQIEAQPSTTIVSHISKDGHYYIHPDPSQMRSLTVREAARLQSFPDDYFFEGSRTQQYHQVGNAVPPLLAWKIGNSVAAAFDGLMKSTSPVM